MEGDHNLIAVLLPVFGEEDTEDNTFQSSETVTVHGRTIYIRADGSIDPSTAPISTIDNVTYTLTGNIHHYSVVLERDNVIVDGDGHTLEGFGEHCGFFLSDTNNVTIQNTNIKYFRYGLWFNSSSFNTVSGNNITNSWWYGIRLEYSSNNIIYGNNMTDNLDDIYLDYSSNNTISRNNIINNFQGYACGIELFVSSNNTISENNMANSSDGLVLVGSSNNTMTKNKLRSNNIGIVLFDSSNNSIIENNITNSNLYGIDLHESSGNIIYHNIFEDNIQHVHAKGWPWFFPSMNTWDDGYPSGGNYWSDYTGVDEKSGPNQDQPSSDGIGDTAYVIDANNTDHYPLMNPWTPPEHTVTVYSSPIGVTFTVDGVSHTTPWSGTYIEGASVSLVMSETHDGYVWSHWLEDGDTNRIKTVTMDTDISLTAVFTQDTTPPTISIVSPENKTYPVEDVPLTFTVSESTSWIGYSFDGQANITIAGNTTLTGLSDGMHSLIVYASDIAGNVGYSDMVYFTIQTTPIDTTPPTADAGMNQEANVGTLVTFDASDSTDNVAIVSCEWDFGDGTTDTGMTCNHTYTEPGNYTVTLTVKDAAGNLDTDTLIVAVTEESQSPFPWWTLGVTAVVVIGIAVVATFLWRRRGQV